MLNFYVDESGNTGNHVFDAEQPRLYYGVLSSPLNLDAVAGRHVEAMRRKLSVPRLHAAEIGLARLASIASELHAAHRALDLRFDFFWLEKVDYAFVQFFDQVFDQGLNSAVPWTSYWSPLRYMLLVRLATIADHGLVERAWAARLNRNPKTASAELAQVCEELRRRVHELPDERTKQIVYDALSWAIVQPETLYYGTSGKQEAVWISPNLIGFQWVLQGIGMRIKKRKPRPRLIRITVDQQAQFNAGQRSLADFYRMVRDVPFVTGPGMPVFDFKTYPTAPLTFASSAQSFGLELVDLFLWLIKKAHDGHSFPLQLRPLMSRLVQQAYTDSLSIEGIARRWEPHFAASEGVELTPEQLARAQELFALDEERRIKAMTSHGVEQWTQA